MTKDSGDLTQFNTVACREYTLPREDDASQPRGCIQGHTKIGPVLEVATSYLQGKYGVEIRIWSLNRDDTLSWVRISHGSNKFVMNLNNNDTEIPEDQLEDQALHLNAKDFACRSKGKVVQQFESCSTTRRGNCSTTRRRSCSTNQVFQSTQLTPNPIRDRTGRLV